MTPAPSQDHGTALVPSYQRLWHAARALTWQRVLWAACVLLFAAVAVDQVTRSLDFVVDDAYITFSFSKNLGTGHGPVFSHGLRVEGYSNFLWMVLVAVRYLFSSQGDPLTFARCAAFACLALTLVATYRLTRRAAGPAAAFVSVGLLVCCSDLFRAAASGLETVPFAAAITVGWLVYLAEPAERRRWSLLCFVPAALLRIDGFVPMLVVIGAELVWSVSARRWSLVGFLRWLAPALAIWAAYFVWRYQYYGLPLPTTYYAKQVVTQGDADRGFRQAYDLVRDYGVLALLPLGVAPLWLGPRRQAAMLTLAVTLQVAHAINVGGDWMPFNRFFLPIVPLAAVLVGWGAEHAFRVAGKYAWPTRFAARVSLLSALAFAAVHLHAAWVDSPQESAKLGSAAHEGAHCRDDLLAVKDLMAYVVRRPGDRLATDYAGVFSVFTDAEIIDMWGLCNADIALNGSAEGINPIYGKACPQCFARLKPDYFHIVAPMARGRTAFRNVSEVVSNVFEGDSIDRVIHIRRKFAAGRVFEQSTGRTLWFLERRRPELPLTLRRPAPGIEVDYPFEAQP